MRVIAGEFRSRLLQAPKGTATRPTSDRLRETLFNVLGPRVEGSRFVDLYAGSGAVGIEAISRGAEFVWFAEREKPAVTAIRANLAALKIGGGYALEDRGVGKLLESMVEKERVAEIVYLDPPWEAAEEYDFALHFLCRNAKGCWLRVRLWLRSTARSSRRRSSTRRRVVVCWSGIGCCAGGCGVEFLCSCKF